MSATVQANFATSSVADNDAEYFDVVDERNQVIGRERRGYVHANGLRHRATHVFLFSSDGRLLLQQRSPRKKIAPSKWDLSCAEHNSPGETYEQTAIRGLREELGVNVEESSLIKARESFFYKGEYTEQGVKDYEFIGTFFAVYDGNITADGNEVVATAYWRVEDVLSTVQSRPEKFTPWLLVELETVDLVKLSKEVQRSSVEGARTGE